MTVNPLHLPQSLRKIIGTILLVCFVSIYALAAMVFAARLLPETSWWVQAVYYIVAGLNLVIPAAGIVYFMQKKILNDIYFLKFYSKHKTVNLKA